MSFNTIIRQQVSQAMALLTKQGLGVSVTYVHHLGTVYDPVSGTSTNSTITSPGAEGVMVRITHREIDEPTVRAHDHKFITTKKALRERRPSLNDYLVQGAETWDIQRIMDVPGQEVVILHVRRRG